MDLTKLEQSMDGFKLIDCGIISKVVGEQKERKKKSYYNCIDVNAPIILFS